MSNPNCYVSDCPDNCCNLYGTCTQDFDPSIYDSTYTTCYYYYDHVSGIIAGVVAGVGLLIIMIVFIFCIKRKRDQEAALH